jgi:hypothetical protein
MTDEAKSELYKFVRDRHDKLIAARAMAQTRLGHLLILTGFLVTALINVGIPQLFAAFESKHWWSRVLSNLALAVFVLTLFFLGLLIRQLLGAVSRFAFAIPNAKADLIEANLSRDDLDASYV